MTFLTDQLCFLLAPNNQHPPTTWTTVSFLACSGEIMVTNLSSVYYIDPKILCRALNLCTKCFEPIFHISPHLFPFTVVGGHFFNGFRCDCGSLLLFKWVTSELCVTMFQLPTF